MSPKTLNILIVEDNANDVDLIKRQLAKGGFKCEYRIVEKEADFSRELRESQPDLILSDYRMPQFNGLAALEIVQQKYPHLPFIFVTGSMSEDVAVQTIQAGAWDYVIKEHLVRLTSAVSRVLKLKSEIILRENTQRQLVESEELHRTIFETAGDVIAVIDSQCVVHECNNQVYELLGIKAQEIIGQVACNFIGEHQREKARRIMAELLISGKVYNKEFQLFHQNGKAVDVIINATGLRKEGSSYQLIVVLVHDITSRKYLEKQVQKSEKQESLSLLAGGIAHDFNNILTIVMGNASLARMYAKGDEKLLRNIEKIEAAGQRAKELTQQLLLFAKGHDLNIKSGSITDLIRESAQFILSGSSVKPEVAIADDIWAVEMDEGQISQVLNYLIINAIQAMPNGGRLFLSAENAVISPDDPILLNPGEYVRLTIRDQGVGIPPENIAKLFTPYFSTKEKGNGLGLANCYTIIKNHRGLITVESEVGVGTTFNIYLPATKTKQ